jgi:hypothetical protein
VIGRLRCTPDGKLWKAIVILPDGTAVVGYGGTNHDAKRDCERQIPDPWRSEVKP